MKIARAILRATTFIAHDFHQYVPLATGSRVRQIPSDT
jgi:hypothetical protein